MNYSEYEEWINETASSASETSRLLFAYETVKKLHEAARDSINAELTGEEKDLISEIMHSMEGDSDELIEKLETLDQGLYSNAERRKLQPYPDLMEFLCSLAHWVDYRVTGNPTYIAAIGINMINAIDIKVGGSVKGYSINDILTADEMRSELERQEGLLCELGLSTDA